MQICSDLTWRARRSRDANILCGGVAMQIFCADLTRRKYFVRRSRDANILCGGVAMQIFCSQLS